MQQVNSWIGTQVDGNHQLQSTHLHLIEKQLRIHCNRQQDLDLPHRFYKSHVYRMHKHGHSKNKKNALLCGIRFHPSNQGFLLSKLSHLTNNDTLPIRNHIPHKKNHYNNIYQRRDVNLYLRIVMSTLYRRL